MDSAANKVIGKLAANYTNELKKEFKTFALHLAEKWGIDESLVSDAVASYEVTAPTKQTKDKNSRPKKDPNAPKGPKTPYIFFSTERRKTLKEENPVLKFGEIGAKLGKEWREMPEKDKKKYEKLATKDKERYEKEMAEFKGTNEDKTESVKDGKNSQPKSELEKLKDGRERAQQKSDDEGKVFCYNVSSGRLLLFNEKKPGDKAWATTVFLCANDSEKLQEAKEKLGLEDED